MICKKIHTQFTKIILTQITKKKSYNLKVGDYKKVGLQLGFLYFLEQGHEITSNKYKHYLNSPANKKKLFCFFTLMLLRWDYFFCFDKKMITIFFEHQLNYIFNLI